MVAQLQGTGHVLAEKVERYLPKGLVLRDVLVFLAGAEAFHTLTHAWLGLSGALPVAMPFFPAVELTQGVNVLAIAINALVTGGLLLWVTRLKKQPAR